MKHIIRHRDITESRRCMSTKYYGCDKCQLLLLTAGVLILYCIYLPVIVNITTVSLPCMETYWPDRFWRQIIVTVIIMAVFVVDYIRCFFRRKNTPNSNQSSPCTIFSKKLARVKSFTARLIFFRWQTGRNEYCVKSLLSTDY